MLGLLLTNYKMPVQRTLSLGTTVPCLSSQYLVNLWFPSSGSTEAGIFTYYRDVCRFNGLHNETDLHIPSQQQTENGKTNKILVGRLGGLVG